MTFPLGFSTCWNHRKHADGAKMLEEILELGFDGIELSHGLSIAKLADIRKFYQKKPFPCFGVHNFFPAPMEVLADNPDCYEFSSAFPQHRKRALRLTLETIDVACELNAKYVVLHLGSAPMPHYSSKLNRMLEEGKAESSEYLDMFQEAVRRRQRKGETVFAQVQEALEIIIEHAKKQKIKIGIEVRSHLEQIPDEAETFFLLNAFSHHSHLGYWHDFGHAQRRENLGLLQHEEWLSTLKEHILGAHVQDILWPHHDHLAPFTGDLNFSSLLSYFPEKSFLTWELSPHISKEEILSSLKLWKKYFN